ncbi:MAG: hypothetical protein EXS55_03665 [Candidatus Magasanikbacteria bacterium]|nr:hypothetical protein [Candidatus Magasanikbacteria bacterium]
MPTLIFDIETIGEDYDALDATTQKMLTRWLKKESYDEDEYQNALADIKNGLGFSPLTGEIVAIGVLDAEKNKGVVYYQAPTASPSTDGRGIKGEGNHQAPVDEEENDIVFKQRTEKEMLECFWQGAKGYNNFVSFNGRGFDVPYLMVRSAIHKIKPSKNLLSNRYLSLMRAGAKHIDLLDQLSFYGAVRRKGSLHLWCRALGIKSPKADGVDGDDVAGLFKAKKFLDIAKYNVGDLRATGELFEYWKEYFDL